MILVLILCLIAGWMIHNFNKRVHGCTLCNESCVCDDYESVGICSHCDNVEEPDFSEEGEAAIDQMGNHWIKNGEYWTLDTTGSVSQEIPKLVTRENINDEHNFYIDIVP